MKVTTWEAFSAEQSRGVLSGLGKTVDRREVRDVRHCCGQTECCGAAQREVQGLLRTGGLPERVTSE